MTRPTGLNLHVFLPINPISFSAASPSLLSPFYIITSQSLSLSSFLSHPCNNTRMDFHSFNAKMERLSLKLARKDAKMIARAKMNQEKGNNLFHAGDFVNASSIYEEIISTAVEDMPLDIDNYMEAHNLIASLHLKISACQFKLGNFDRVISSCSLVLKNLDSKSVEGLFLRGQTYLNVGDFESAKLDLEKAVEIEPDNEEIKLELVKLQGKMMEVKVNSDGEFKGKNKEVVE